MLEFLKRSPTARSLLSATAGFIGYGAWAAIANYSHGVEAALMAACVQGTFSFVITLILTGLMEGLYRHCKTAKYGGQITVVITCSILYISSYGINFIAGTPNIIYTILPGAIFSTVYVVGYVATLKKLAQ